MAVAAALEVDATAAAAAAGGEDFLEYNVETGSEIGTLRAYRKPHAVAISNIIMHVIGTMYLDVVCCAIAERSADGSAS